MNRLRLPVDVDANSEVITALRGKSSFTDTRTTNHQTTRTPITPGLNPEYARTDAVVMTIINSIPSAISIGCEQDGCQVDCKYIIPRHDGNTNLRRGRNENSRIRKKSQPRDHAYFETIRPAVKYSEQAGHGDIHQQRTRNSFYQGPSMHLLCARPA